MRACVCMWDRVCMDAWMHGCASLSDISNPSLHTHLTSPGAGAHHSGPHVPHPHEGPWVKAAPAEKTWGGTGRVDSELIAGSWACLFAWHAFVSACFIQPLSQLRSSQFILPARGGQIGGTHARSQKPNIDFQLSFNFAPVFICSFHFFQTD